MPDLHVSFAEVIETLRTAQAALLEGQALLSAQEPNVWEVLDLLNIARNCADQAQALMRIMKDNGVEHVSLTDARKMADFFWATEDILEAKLGLGQG